MEKMKTVDVGLLKTIISMQGAFDCRAITEVSFVDTSTPTGLETLHNERCYLVKKDDLDAYMARKESLEKKKGTPDWYLSNRIKQLEAENANLREINKALRATNKKLTAENAELDERVRRLEILKSFLENGNKMLTIENNKLHGTKNELDATVAKLKQDLANFTDEHTVEFLYEKHENGKHFIGWTEVSGEEYELTFVTPEHKIHE